MDLTESRISSESVYDGALLHVRRDRVRLPDGGSSVREWIDHPGAAAAVPVFADGTVLLVRQFRYPPGREFLEVPAGKLDRPGEDPLDLARRELEEEAGLRAERWTPLGKTYPGIGYSNEVIHLYLAEGLTEVEPSLEDGEFVVPVRMPFADAVELAKRGEVLDGKTAVALLLADAERARRDENRASS